MRRQPLQLDLAVASPMHSYCQIRSLQKRNQQITTRSIVISPVNHQITKPLHKALDSLEYVQARPYNISSTSPFVLLNGHSTSMRNLSQRRVMQKYKGTIHRFYTDFEKSFGRH